MNRANHTKSVAKPQSKKLTLSMKHKRETRKNVRMELIRLKRTLEKHKAMKLTLETFHVY